MEVYSTRTYRKWINRLKDKNAKALIRVRLLRIRLDDNLGDFKELTTNVSELRFYIGPGYRIYFTMKGNKMIILLVGGNKGSQARDIKRAEKMATDNIREEVEKWY